MRKWNEQIAFIRSLERVTDVYWAVFDKCWNILAQCRDFAKIPPVAQWIRPVCESQNSNTYELLLVGRNVYIWFFELEDRFFVFGPICTRQLKSEDLFSFRQKNGLLKTNIRPAMFPIQKSLDLVRLSYLGLTGKEAVFTADHSLQALLTEEESKNKTEYDLYRLYKQTERMSYEEERAWYNSIRNGTVKSTWESETSADRIGMLSKENELKQVEYMVVSGITLATRAAIEGGVPPHVAYETSDLLLQRLSGLHHISQLENGEFDFNRINVIFSDLVVKYQGDRRAGIMVELCKDYVTKHLYSSFSIEWMAQELAINRSHLSRTFSKKTGMTLQQYIRQERLNAAANLLKYSEISVSEIADYTQFSTPSKFSAYFKNAYGLTPLRYREANKPLEFVSHEKK